LAYVVPVWETLAAALRRVVAAGSKKAEAKRGLCSAMADKAITIRLVLAADKRLNLPELSASGAELDLPARLLPGDIDWKRSRPIKPWPLPRRSHSEFMLVHASRVAHLVDRTIEAIEVRSSDVSRIFIGPATQVVPKAARASLSRKSASGAKTRGINEALASLWPDGLPDGLIAKDRNNQIRQYLIDQKLSVPADLSRIIQRALKKRLRSS
jgi:hypothetical protein